MSREGFLVAEATALNCAVFEGMRAAAWLAHNGLRIGPRPWTGYMQTDGRLALRILLDRVVVISPAGAPVLDQDADAVSGPREIRVYSKEDFGKIFIVAGSGAAETLGLAGEDIFRGLRGRGNAPDDRPIQYPQIGDAEILTVRRDILGHPAWLLLVEQEQERTVTSAIRRMVRRRQAERLSLTSLVSRLSAENGWGNA